MDISEYRNKNRKPITLPSGMEGFIRRPAAGDVIAYPAVLKRQHLGEEALARDIELALKFEAEWRTMLMRRCFIPKVGEMTEKEPNLCGPNELSIYDLSPEDSAAIIDSVHALVVESEEKNNAQKEAAAADASFPEDTEKPAGEAAPTGSDIPDAAPPSA